MRMGRPLVDIPVANYSKYAGFKWRRLWKRADGARHDPIGDHNENRDRNDPGAQSGRGKTSMRLVIHSSGGANRYIRS